MGYKVELDVFAGPLDLLLYLIRKEEVEIHEVEIAKICDQYMAYLRMLRSLEIDVSADFLVLASTLMVIKARKMLPGEEVDLEEELDPEDDLIKQLLEYKKYKTLARDLHARAIERHRRFAVRRRERGGEVPLEEIGIFDLFSAFSKLVQETSLGRAGMYLKGDKPIREYVRELAETLRHAPRLLFRDLFGGPLVQGDLIGMFVALLELIKLQVIRATQGKPFAEIEVELIGDPDVALTLYDAELAWDDSAPDAEESAVDRADADHAAAPEVAEDAVRPESSPPSERPEQRTERLEPVDLDPMYRADEDQQAAGSDGAGEPAPPPTALPPSASDAGN